MVGIARGLTWTGAAAAAALTALASTSCHKAGPKGAYAVRDSSGVQIVSNPSAVADNSACPRLDTVPALTIGGANAEGPADVQRVIGVRRLPDGGVVVLNGATSELRYFDRAGRYVRTVGRSGSGPAEFKNPGAMRLFGADTLAVHDFGNARITLLGPDGKVVGAIPLRGMFGGSLLGRLSDGSLLFWVLRGYREGAPTGRRRDPMYLVRVSREGAVLDTLGTFPGFENLVEGDANRVMVTSAPFARGTYFAMAGERVYVGDNAEYRVRVYGDGRRLERIIERAYEEAPLTAAVVERQKAQRSRGASDPRFREQLERMYQRDRLPETLPAFGSLAVDADGWLWVRGYQTATEGNLAWDVFDAGGRLRCAVTLPSAVSAREIGHDYLLGVATDADGVEQVRLYRMRRNATAPI